MRIKIRIVMLLVLFQVALFGALPPTPTGLSVVETTDRNITLSWDAYTNLDWIGYKVYSVTKGPTYTLIDTVNGINVPQYTVTAIPAGGTPLTADTTYEFVVTTLSEGRDFVIEESKYSQSVIVSTTAKPPITVNTPSGSSIDGNLATCTLAEAIMSANTDTSVDGCTAGNGSDTIVFSFDTSVPVVLDTALSSDLEAGLPSIESNITLQGNPTTIEIDPLADDIRIFDINQTGVLTLNSTIIQNGRGLAYGGAIKNEGTLILNNTTLQNNQVIEITFMLDFSLGGAIANSGEAFINRSIIVNNSADNSTGYGGAIYTGPILSDANDDSNLIITNSTIHSNSAKYGGGIVSMDGNIKVTDSTISSNTAISDGGGMTLSDDAYAIITHSTFKENIAVEYKGGAIVVANATLVLENTTITQNVTQSSSPGQPGAGVAIYGGGNVEMKNVTISDNYGGADGLGISNEGTLSMSNTIVANSMSGDPSGGLVFIKDDVTGDVPVKNISNLIERDVSVDWSDTCTNCISGIDPMLEPLSDNGGQTLTQALMKGSPAIDAGNLTECPIYTLTPLVRKDQRYVDRDEQCDIGAYEYQEKTVQPLPAVIMYLLN